MAKEKAEQEGGLFLRRGDYSTLLNLFIIAAFAPPVECQPCKVVLEPDLP